MPISAIGLNVPSRDVRVGQVMINKAKIYKKYPFKQMQSGDAFKLDDADVRDAVPFHRIGRIIQSGD
jgi:hypothetical protein